MPIAFQMSEQRNEPAAKRLRIRNWRNSGPAAAARTPSSTIAQYHYNQRNSVDSFGFPFEEQEDQDFEEQEDQYSHQRSAILHPVQQARVGSGGEGLGGRGGEGRGGGVAEG